MIERACDFAHCEHRHTDARSLPLLSLLFALLVQHLRRSRDGSMTMNQCQFAWAPWPFSNSTITVLLLLRLLLATRSCSRSDPWGSFAPCLFFFLNLQVHWRMGFWAPRGIWDVQIQGRLCVCGRFCRWAAERIWRSHTCEREVRSHAC